MSDCPQDLLSEVARIAGDNREKGLRKVDTLIQEYPGDGRLHFLRGSLLAGLQDYAEARKALAAAVELAPGFALARFQLGLLDLTSGDPASAQSIWAPLDGLPQGHPLRLFVMGLRSMILDDFPQAIALLEQGIARNVENAPLNGDMQLLVREMIDKIGAADSERDREITSSAQMLLQQSEKQSTKH